MAGRLNPAFLSDFLDYLRIEKGLASLSISAYGADIAQFSDFLEKRKRSLVAARQADLRQFVQQLFSHQVDGRSVGRKLSALRHFYRYLLLDKKIEHDPTLNIESPKQWKVLPKALARDEMEATLDAPSTRTQGGREPTRQSAALELRDHAMVEVFYAGALRVSEVTNAKLGDLKLDSGYMLVRGKGDKERVVPLGKSAVNALSKYLKESRGVLTIGKGNQPRNFRDASFLFIGRGGGKLTRQRVWQMVRSASSA